MTLRLCLCVVLSVVFTCCTLGVEPLPEIPVGDFARLLGEIKPQPGESVARDSLVDERYPGTANGDC